jgi:hypothetical protein
MASNYQQEMVRAYGAYAPGIRPDFTGNAIGDVWWGRRTAYGIQWTATTPRMLIFKLITRYTRWKDEPPFKNRNQPEMDSFYPNFKITASLINIIQICLDAFGYPETLFDFYTEAAGSITPKAYARLVWLANFAPEDSTKYDSRSTTQIKPEDLIVYSASTSIPFVVGTVLREPEGVGEFTAETWDAAQAPPADVKAFDTTPIVSGTTTIDPVTGRAVTSGSYQSGMSLGTKIAIGASVLVAGATIVYLIKNRKK